MTHDTKRSADVRARHRRADLGARALGGARRAAGWQLTEPLRDRAARPTTLERYFLFQTLVGAWPIEAERIQAYMEKALREAKRNTSWTEQNDEWEQGGERLHRRGLSPTARCARELDAFARELEFAGDCVALRTVALKLTVPGVPDIYQGDEMPLFAPRGPRQPPPRRLAVEPDDARPPGRGRRSPSRPSASCG